MKMLRHPNILMFQDGLETDKSVFIVSERVQTLYSYLNESKENASQKENEIAWGLHQIAVSHPDFTFERLFCLMQHLVCVDAF